jgi:hypothetical protein
MSVVLAPFFEPSFSSPMWKKPDGAQFQLILTLGLGNIAQFPFILTRVRKYSTIPVYSHSRVRKYSTIPVYSHSRVRKYSTACLKFMQDIMILSHLPHHSILTG